MDWLKEALADLWNVIKDTFFGWVEGLWDLVAWAVNAIVNYFWAVVDYCLQMAWNFGYYLYDLFLGEDGFVWYILDFGIWAGKWFVDNVFPDLSQVVVQYEGSFDTTIGLVSRLDMFFPITEFFVLFGTFFAFVFFYLGAKLILKLVPGIG